MGSHGLALLYLFATWGANCRFSDVIPLPVSAIEAINKPTVAMTDPIQIEEKTGWPRWITPSVT